MFADLGSVVVRPLVWWQNLHDRRTFMRQRHDYYDYLAALLEGGAGSRTLKDVFWQDSVRYGDRTLRGRLSKQWLALYEQAGGDLYATWQQHLPASELSLIRTAQSLGNQALLSTLFELSQVLGLLKEASRLLAGLLWPALLALFASILVTLAIPTFTAVHLLDTFSWVPPEYYGTTTRRFLAFSSVVERYALLVLGLVAALAGGILWSFENLQGRLRRLLDSWLWWHVYRQIAALRFLSFLIIALGADTQNSVQLRHALLSQHSGASRWLTGHIDCMVGRLHHGLVGASSLDTGLLSPEQFWFLSDMVNARGLRQGLILARNRLRDHITITLARQAQVARWAILLSCLFFIVSLALWHYAVIDDLRRALTIYLSSA